MSAQHTNVLRCNKSSGVLPPLLRPPGKLITEPAHRTQSNVPVLRSVLILREGKSTAILSENYRCQP